MSEESAAMHPRDFSIKEVSDFIYRPDLDRKDLESTCLDLADEIARLRKGLEDIKQHIEAACPKGHQLSGAWNIAYKVLGTYYDK